MVIKFNKKLIILMDIILFSVLFGLISLVLYSMDFKLIILFGLSFGLILDLCILIFIIYSLKSEQKWIIIIDFNHYYEGIPELILFIVIIGFEFLAIIITFIIM